MSATEDFDAFLTLICHHSADAQSVADLRSLARTMSVERGKLARLDQLADQLVFIAKGSTKLVAHASDGRDQVVAFHFAGDLVSVPARAAHVYTLTALDSVSLITFPATRLLQIAVREPLIQAEIIRRMLTALHRSRDKSVGLGRKTAAERIASFLVTMGQRIGRVSHDNIRLDLPMSRKDISDNLGLTIETVSRQFTQLRKEGLVVTVGRSGVELRDQAALIARAGQMPTAI